MAGKAYPAIYRYDSRTGVGYALLNDSLDVHIGDVVKVTGKVSVDTMFYKVRNVRSNFNVLNVITTEKLIETGKFISKAQQQYQQNRTDIQNAIAIKNSKLVLPESPDWNMFVDNRHNRIIVSMQTNDLMYVAEADFVFDLITERLQSVYAKQWFKGE